jgi:hypothetical protein
VALFVYILAPKYKRRSFWAAPFLVFYFKDSRLGGGNGTWVY